MQQGKIELVSIQLANTTSHNPQYRRPLVSTMSDTGMAKLEAFIKAKVNAWDSDMRDPIDFNGDDLVPFVTDLVDYQGVAGDLVRLPTVHQHWPGMVTTGWDQPIARFRALLNYTSAIGAKQKYVVYGWADRPVEDDGKLSDKAIMVINSFHHIREHHLPPMAAGEPAKVVDITVENQLLLVNPYYNVPGGQEPRIQRTSEIAGAMDRLRVPEIMGNVQVYDSRSVLGPAPKLVDMTMENPINYLGKVLGGLFDTYAHLWCRNDNLTAPEQRDHANKDLAMSSRDGDTRRNPVLQALAPTNLDTPVGMFTFGSLVGLDPNYADKVTFGNRTTSYEATPEKWDDSVEAAFAFKFGMSFLGVAGRYGIAKFGYHYNNTGTTVASGFYDGINDVLGVFPHVDMLEDFSADLKALCKTFTLDDTINMNVTVQFDLGNEAVITLAVNDHAGKVFVLPLFASALNSGIITTAKGLEDMAGMFNMVSDMMQNAFNQKVYTPTVPAEMPVTLNREPDLDRGSDMHVEITPINQGPK